MIYTLFFLLEIVTLFFLSRHVQRSLGSFIYSKVKNKNIAIYLMSFLFFPGTFLHEMAHFLAALFLLVPVGNVELLPRIEDKSIVLGSVQIAKTDPIRKFFVSSAPLFFGISIILLIVYFFTQNTTIFSFRNMFSLYLIFTFSNTMFMSKKDMEGLWVFPVLLAFLGLVMIFFGINIDLSSIDTSNWADLLKKSSQFLIIPLILDIIALMLLKNYGRRS